MHLLVFLHVAMPMQSCHSFHTKVIQESQRTSSLLAMVKCNALSLATGGKLDKEVVVQTTYLHVCATVLSVTVVYVSTVEYLLCTP